MRYWKQEEITFVAVRSRGPGGQNVNKVSSAAVLYWSFASSPGLSDHQKFLISQKLGHTINKDGQIWLRSDEFRDLEKNKARCLEKLEALLAAAFHQPKRRKAGKPTYSSRVKKRESKTHRSQTKKFRQRVHE